YFLSTIGWIYWSLTEWYSGQSAGKYVMKIKTTDLEGNSLSLHAAFLEAFGKAVPVVFPLDMIIGTIAFEPTRQRLFSHLAKVIVIETVQPHEMLNVEYVR
ncbi:MAG: RDD family protein, partial [archaeon]